MTPKLTLRDPADVAAAVPFLLGFHPTDSLVVIGLRDGLTAMVQRWDLDPDVGGLAGAVADVLAPGAADAVLLAGYGPADLVSPVVARLTQLLPVPVQAAVRVESGRCYCELCDSCSPAQGVPFDFASSPVAAQATVAGLSVLPSREALTAQVAPTGGVAQAAMAQSVRRADDRLGELLVAARTDRDPFGVAALYGQGILAVDDALAAAEGGRHLDDDQVAWLTLLLHSLPVRDHAWVKTDHEPWQVSLWTDVTRRAEPSLVAPPASLLAFAAWRDGNGPLAGVALERALRCEPTYSLALLIRDAMLHGVSPAHLGGWPGSIQGRRVRRTAANR
jgi:hypothetical protein